jgi:hypothetical protein
MSNALQDEKVAIDNLKEFQLPRGVEILAKQILKMMNFDPGLVLGQISDIQTLMQRFVANQDEILTRLKRIEEFQNDPDFVSDGDRPHKPS